MHLLELTLSTAAENLALDEALLETLEQGSGDEVLRLWEPASTFVVVGRASRVEQEVRLEICRQQNVPVYRRSSGGAAIVTGRGCLMYAVVLRYDHHPAARMLDEAHRLVLETTAAALGRLAPGVKRQGTSDLVLADGSAAPRKFSGNSLRCRRHGFLCHGTLLYDFPVAQIEELLGVAPRQPEYRQGRRHAAFVANFPAPGAQLRRALIEAWRADSRLSEWPQALTTKLAAEKYRQDSWNFSR